MFSEKVHHPDHYQGCSDLGKHLLSQAEYPHKETFDFECIEVIEELGFDFSLGSCFKYLWRLGKKKTFLWFTDTTEDLKKALWYVDRYIMNSHEQSVFIEPWIYNLKNVLNNAVIERVINIRS